MSFRVTFVQRGERMAYEVGLADQQTADALAEWLAANGYYFDAGVPVPPSDLRAEVEIGG